MSDSIVGVPVSTFYTATSPSIGRVARLSSYRSLFFAITLGATLKLCRH